MLFKVVDDWKQNLHPDDEVRLNDILRRIQQHRSAYRSSKDVKTAQLWCALLEMDKRNQRITEDLVKMEMIIEGFADVLRRAQNINVSGRNGKNDDCCCECSCERESKRDYCCDDDRCGEAPNRSRDRKLIESLEKF